MLLEDLLTEDNIEKHAYIVKKEESDNYKTLSQYETNLLVKSGVLEDVNKKIKFEVEEILKKQNETDNFLDLYVLPNNNDIKNYFVNERSITYKKELSRDNFIEAIEKNYIHVIYVTKIYIVVDIDFLNSVSEAILGNADSKYKYTSQYASGFIKDIRLIRTGKDVAHNTIVFNFDNEKNYTVDLDTALNKIVTKCKSFISEKYNDIVKKEYERLDTLFKDIETEKE